MVREHEHAPARTDHVHRLVEPVREVRELTIDLHADRLEGAPRRVRASTAGRGGNRVAHDLGQLTR